MPYRCQTGCEHLCISSTINPNKSAKPTTSSGEYWSTSDPSKICIPQRQKLWVSCWCLLALSTYWECQTGNSLETMNLECIDKENQDKSLKSMSNLGKSLAFMFFWICPAVTKQSLSAVQKTTCVFRHVERWF